MVERLSIDQIAVDGNESDARKFIESDFKIRSGLCPNNCGLMVPEDFGQRCERCNFFCNTKSECVQQ